MKVKNNTATLLMRMGRIIKAHMHGDVPFSLTQIEILRMLETHKEATMHTIAERFGITAPSATAAVSDLVRKGLLTRAASKVDRRQIMLRLSPEGVAMHRGLEKKRAKALDQVFAVLSDHDRSQLEDILSKVVSAHSHI